MVVVSCSLGAVYAALAADGPFQTFTNEPPIRQIVFGGDENFPPYEFLDQNGRPAGLNVDLIRAIGRDRGIEVRVELFPWAQMKEKLLSGKVDVATMYRSAQRAQWVEFCMPHEVVYHEMYVRAGSPPLRSLFDAAGKRILLEMGAYADDAVTAMALSTNMVRAKSEPEALRLLAQEQGDVAIVAQTVGRPFLQQSDSAVRIVSSGPPVLLSEYSYVTRHKRRQLVDLLNDGLFAVKASGEYSRIYDKWLGLDRSARLARIAAWVFAAAFSIIIVIVAWNQSLRRLVVQKTEALRLEFEQRERVQVTLAQNERILRQSQKMETVGRLAGAVAHDFNNVLTIILGYGQMLRDRMAGAGNPTEDADEILAAAERGSRLTKQLLVFSRETPITVARLNLGELVRNLQGMVRRLVGEDIRVAVSLVEDAVFIEADRTQIEQALLNLAANARDAMPQGGLLTIIVGTRDLLNPNPHGLPHGKYALITVVDTGVGMDETTLAQIFEPFFTTKEVGKGTGLGLATVSAHVAKLGGKVEVHSAVGRGATFQILLPRIDPEPNDFSRAAAPTLAATGGAGECVLLAEDDEALRRAVNLTLHAAGYRVIEASDGEGAIELANRGLDFRVLVTDVVMPRMNGAKLAQILRLRHPGLLVLYVSGWVEKDVLLDLEVPGTAFLAKPYTTSMLVEAVGKLIAEENLRNTFHLGRSSASAELTPTKV